MVEVLSSRILLRTTDFSRTLTFYRDVLGLRVYREYGEGGRRTGVVLFAGGGFIEVTSSPPRAGERSGDSADLWLQVPDLGETCAALARQDVVFEQEPRRMPWGLDEAWVRDPDGRHLVLVEVPEGHPIRTRLE